MVAMLLRSLITAFFTGLFLLSASICPAWAAPPPTMTITGQAGVWTSSSLLPGEQFPLDIDLTTRADAVTFEFAPITVGPARISLRRSGSGEYDPATGALRLDAPLLISVAGTRLSTDLTLSTTGSYTLPQGDVLRGVPVDGQGRLLLTGAMTVPAGLFSIKAWFAVSGVLS
ncbi:hypothetical protein D5S17_04560 [Pseudonocardiaceae bacterium YIM PH 21723]|nr:hypothetical protein D5S17_04560 [Pseudonocardiaceae bacterium YIM PH 21723]